MIDSRDFDDDDLDFDDDDDVDFPIRKRMSDMTLGERLRRFKQFFDSSSRAMLQDCRFRVVDDEDGIGTLEILCPNEVVLKRLSKKTMKISITINTAWSHVKRFSLCVEQDGELRCQRFILGGERIGSDT